MDDIKKIRQQLWVSMDMAYVRRHFIVLVVVGGLAGMMGGVKYSDLPWVMPLALAIVEGPILAFLAYRTWKIFRRAEHYIIQEAVLDCPFGGWGRNTIRFTVTVNNSQGRSHRVDTHGIFFTRSVIGPNIEDYVNRKVRVAYNEETETLVVIA